jgi:hypothetical protein
LTGNAKREQSDGQRPVALERMIRTVCPSLPDGQRWRMLAIASGFRAPRRKDWRGETTITLELLLGRAIEEGKSLPAIVEIPYAEILAATGGKDSRNVEGQISKLIGEKIADRVPGNGCLIVLYGVPDGAAQIPTRPDPQRHLPGIAETDCDDTEATVLRLPEGVDAQHGAQDVAQHAEHDGAQHDAQHTAHGLGSGSPEELRMIAHLQALQDREQQRIQSSRPPHIAGDVEGAPRGARQDLRSPDEKQTQRDLRSAETAARTEREAPGESALAVTEQRIKDLRMLVPDLDPRTARKVARGIEEGWLDWERVEKAIDYGRKLVDCGEAPHAWCGFVGCMRRQFADAKQPWTRRRLRGGAP